MTTAGTTEKDGRAASQAETVLALTREILEIRRRRTAVLDLAKSQREKAQKSVAELDKAIKAKESEIAAVIQGAPVQQVLPMAAG